MYVRTKEQVFERLRGAGPELERFGVNSVGLFGSFVRAEQNDQSDVDLLVDFEPDKKSFDNFMNLAFFLEDILGRKVDLVTTQSLSPYIGPKILAEVEYGVIE